MRVSVEQGVEFILSHFGGNNALWPKFIAAGVEFHISVECDYQKVSDNPLQGRPILGQASKEMLSYFYKAKLMDCRICPYPDFVEHYRKPDVRDCMAIEGAGIVPNFLFIDIDKGRFARTLYAYQEDALKEALYGTLTRINEKFHGNFHPTVISTGNGYHIYLPVQLSGPSWCLGHTDVFMEISKTPDRDFLRWAEWYLSDGLCDPEHCKTTSFSNMYCRVPGSFNSKNNKPVTILQKWDGQRPYINWILRDFYNYLIDKKNNPKKPSDYGGFRGFSTKWN